MLPNKKLVPYYKIDPFTNLQIKEELQGYDIYLDGEWLGSRRTEEFCLEYIEFVIRNKTLEN